MSVEEIERYNVLADEIRKLGSELQTAEKSWEIAANRYYEAFQTEVRIEKALEGLASRQSALWSEIGLAIGRIEASIQKAEQSRQEQGTRLNAFAQEIIEDLEKAEKARQGRSEAAKNVFQRLDERLGAIEQRLECDDVPDALQRIEAWQRGLIEELECTRKRIGQLDNRLYMIEKTEFTTLRKMISAIKRPASKSSQRRQRRSKR